MPIEFERFKNSCKSYTPQEGDILSIKPANIPHTFHCKVVKADIRSEMHFMNHGSLLYVFAPQRDGSFLIHDRSSLISVNIFRFDQRLPETFELSGNEPVRAWEKQLDIGIEGSMFGEFVTDAQAAAYADDHRIVKLKDKDDCNIAVPFYDCNSNKMDHIPKIQLQSGFTTERGVLRVITLWLTRNQIV